MAIPDYQTLMLPLLRLVADGEEFRFRDVVDALAQEFRITPEERGALLPSGSAFLFDSRAGWARTYLKQAGLLESPKRGVIRITERGRTTLAGEPSRIDVKFLDRFAEFRDFRARRPEEGRVDRASGEVTPQAGLEIETPEERLATAYATLRADLQANLIDQVKSASPAFFERLVVDLLLAMGYGGSRQDAGRAIGKSGDGGIDGIIKEDKLGLDAIYLQAKRWEGAVGRPEVQKFAGALQGHRASKGVFITTSSFTRDAEDYANAINTKVILINGALLTELMIDHNVGVATTSTYQVKKVDADYFEGE
ncbi:MAG TPA: restriction endonuclease [Rubrivivax sp.]|nr:restriction endonuclease [Rubrivivax sp.]